MSTLTEAVATIDNALRIEAGRMDLFGGYNVAGCEPGYTLTATKDLNQEVAVAQAPTLVKALIVLAGELEAAGYKAPEAVYVP